MIGKKFEQLDGLRFFAIFFVLVQHWGGWFKIYLGQYNVGEKGVDLFFVISGFLITLGLFKAKQRNEKTGGILYKFYIKRALRIFPLYYLALLFFYLFFKSMTADGIVWYIFYAANFYTIKKGAWTGMAHLWSLAVEEQFYLVWPFIICFLPYTREFVFMLIAVIASFMLGLYYSLHGQLLAAAVHPLCNLDALGMGGILAYLYLFHTERLKGILFNSRFVVILILQFVLIQYLSRFFPDALWYSRFSRISYVLLCTWLIGRAVFGFGGVWGDVLELSFLRYIGRISYCIYLIHPVVPPILERLHLPMTINYNVLFLIYFAVTVGIASVSWYLIESRILRFKDRFE